MSYSYSLYLNYPAKLFSADMDTRIERALGQDRSGSGMSLIPQGGRDIDFSFDSMAACHDAVRAACQILPQGCHVWIWQNNLEDEDDMTLVVEETDLHAFKASLDAAKIDQATPRKAQRKARGRL